MEALEIDFVGLWLLGQYTVPGDRVCSAGMMAGGMTCRFTLIYDYKLAQPSPATIIYRLNLE